jgi:uncharacterized protein
MGRVIHFEIHASDTARAVKFYTDVFDWVISKWDGPIEYWLVGTGEGMGIDGAILPRPAGALPPNAPANAFVCTVSVDDVDAATAAVESAGGNVVLAKAHVEGVGWTCYVTDTEGNVLGLMQR